MPDYVISFTKVDAAVVRWLVRHGMAHAWLHPQTGKVRYYLGAEALESSIGLRQRFYRSGNVAGCSYVNIDDEVVTVAHARAYGRDAGWEDGNRTFIDDAGAVHTTWAPYGENIAELIAMRLQYDTPDLR